MKKKIITIITLIIIICSMHGCTGSYDIKTKISDDGQTIEAHDISKSEELVYDSNTKIVYIKQYAYNNNYIYTLYLSENGLPYKYEDGKLVEVGQ